MGPFSLFFLFSALSSRPSPRLVPPPFPTNLQTHLAQVFPPPPSLLLLLPANPRQPSNVLYMIPPEPARTSRWSCVQPASTSTSSALLTGSVSIFTVPLDEPCVPSSASPRGCLPCRDCCLPCRCTGTTPTSIIQACTKRDSSP
ncbi:hypothetical protein K456DRAFT_1498335 [Colletotrichum gloeosporioides 23]|nr:hypothetical protein K456DRAFT_1498335 [Colletotrichum gloeosporioides 23]